MVISDMDNGGSLIDVIDESELFEAEPSSSDFSWADDFISSSEDGLGVQGGAEVVNQTAHGSINTGQLAQPGLVIQQAPQVVRTHETQAAGVQVIQTSHGMVQQQKPEVQNVVQPQQILSNLGNFQQGSGNQIIQGANGQLILKTATGQQILLQTQPTQQIQQIQQHGQTPSQQIQGGTPMVSRSLTPSQSPVPISSPHIGHAVTTISRSMTPNQSSSNMTPVTMVTAAKSQGHVLNSMNAPNVNVLQLQGTSQSQQVLTRNIPLQGVIQMANTNNTINLQAQPAVIQSQGNQILQQAHGTVLQPNQGQATLVSGQGQNIVNTQNTVIQNPNVVNVNVAHVLCNNQLQNQQGGTVHHMANIQGTLIQTPDGKYIITQNPQLTQGQSVNFQNIPQVALQPQQINVAGQTSNQTAGSVGQGAGAIVQGSVSNTNSNLSVGNFLRIAAQPSNQDKQNLATNATHFIGVNQQGQQVLIQRAPAPNNQHQNVILRTLNPTNFLQIQQQANPGNIGATSQAGQVAQQPLIMASQQQQSAQLQKVIGQQGQQVKLLGPGGLQTSAPVTLNLAGQNLNLQSLQGSNAVQTIQIVQQQQQQQQQQQLQQIQLQQQQIQKQVSGASSVVFSDFTSQENRTISPAPPSSAQNTPSMISSQGFSTLSQQSITVASSQVSQQLNQQNIFTLPTSAGRLNTSQIQQVRFATAAAGTLQQHVDNQVQGSPQQLAQSLQNIQLPLNQFSALNAPSLSTASSTGVTTTVSQTRVNSTNINVSNSPLMTQSVQPTASVNMTPPKPPVLQARINAPKLNQSVNPADIQKLQQIQTEISKYSTIKNLTSEQKKHYMTLIEAHRRIVAQNPMLSSKKGQVVIQTTQASVVQAASKLLPDGQQQQVLVQSVNQQQGGVVDNQALSTAGIQFNQQRVIQSQPATGGLILAGNNLVNQSALSSISTPVLTSTTNVTSSITSISSIPVPVQSFNSQTSPQTTVIQSNSVVTSQIAATQSLSTNPMQTNQMTVLNQSVPVQNTTTSGGVVKVQVPTTVVQYNVPPGKVAIPASPQVAVPTQIKIGNHVLSLNLTPQQKEKVQGYLSKLSPEEQQAQLATFLRLQAQQQLQNQIRAQVQNQQQQQTQKLLTTQNTATQLQQQSKIPTTVQNIQQQAVAGADKPVITTTQSLDNQQTVIIAAPGQKLTRLSVASIPKSQLIQQQLSKDQANALNPDVKSSFKTRRDTYRRLLRYHVYQSHERPDSAMQKDEEKFEEISTGLLKKKDWMLNRFHMLLLQESMREKPTSEMVMLQRLINEDLKEKIAEEKTLVKEQPDAFEMMPKHLLEKQESPDSKQKIPKLIDKSNNSATEQIQRQIKTENMDSQFCNEVEIKQEVLDEKPATPKLRLLIKNDGENFTSSIASDIDTEGEGNHRNDISDDDSSKSQTDSSQNNTYSNVFCNTVVKQEPVDVEMNSEGEKWENNKPFQRYFSSDDSQMACDSDIFVSSSQQTISSSGSGLDSIPVNSSHDRFINRSNSLSSNGAHNSPSHNSSVVSPSNNISNISDDSIHDDNDDMSESIQAVKALNESDDLEQNFYLDGYSSKSETYSSGMMYESHPDLVPDNNRESSFSNQNNITDISDSSQQSDNQNYEDHVVTSLSENIQVPVDNLTSIAQASLGQYEPISSPEAEHEESFSNFKVDSSYSVNIGDQKLGYSVPMETNIKLEPNYSQSRTHMSQKKDVHVVDVDNISEEEEEESDRESDPQNELMQSAINSILSLTQDTPPSHPSTSYSYDQSSRYSDSHPGYDSQSEDKMFGNELKTDDISEEEIPMEDDLDAAVNSILF